jgi:hypothetical protein
MKKIIKNLAAALSAAFLFAGVNFLHAQGLSVLTGQYGNARTGANLNEPYLNSSNVNVSTFGKVATLNVDGPVFAQPLYMQGVSIGGLAHNVVYVATMNNSVYAFDADTYAQLWHVWLGPAMPAQSTNGPTCPASWYTSTSLGVLSTPVIDPSTNTLYVVSATHDYSGATTYHHQLFALDVVSGAYKFGSPVTITASVPGSSPDSVNGVINFAPSKLINRPALLLSQGIVSIGFGGCGPDPVPYHGWLLGYNASNLSQVFAFNATPETEGGSIWQSGRGPATDKSGNIYFETGNATSDETTDFGDSLVQLNPRGQLIASMVPSNRPYLDGNDLDLGTTGPIVTPDTNMLIAGGKEGNYYVVNPNAVAQPSGLLGTIAATACTASYMGDCGGIRSTAYWPAPGGGKLYLWAPSDYVRGYQWFGSTFYMVSYNLSYANYPGGILALSAASNGATDAILWAVNNGVLYAMDADVLSVLWASNYNPARDAMNTYHTSQQFTVAAGKVFVPDAGNDVNVYGLITPAVPPPAIQCPSSSATYGQYYSSSVTATGGQAPYTFYLSGNPPPGLTQSGSTLAGTPSKSGSFTYYERVVDSRNNASGTGTASCTVNVAQAPLISGLVYVDVNNNHQYDPGVDTPLSGVPLQLQGPGGVHVTTNSASNGTYSFVNSYSQNGGYQVHVQHINGYDPNSPDNININLVRGQSYPNINFGFKIHH